MYERHIESFVAYFLWLKTTSARANRGGDRWLISTLCRKEKKGKANTSETIVETCKISDSHVRLWVGVGCLQFGCGEDVPVVQNTKFTSTNAF